MSAKARIEHQEYPYDFKKFFSSITFIYHNIITMKFSIALWYLKK